MRSLSRLACFAPVAEKGDLGGTARYHSLKGSPQARRFYPAEGLCISGVDLWGVLAKSPVCLVRLAQQQPTEVVAHPRKGEGT